MKSPWQFGFLALALTGVSAYDYLFYKNYKAQTPIQVDSSQVPAIEPSSQLAPLPESNDSEQPGSESQEISNPPIVREEIFRQARQSYVSRDYSADNRNSPWPARDPFFAREATEPPQVRIYEPPEKNEIYVAKPQPSSKPKSELKCVFSGTLVQGASKLALVNGTPLAIGDRVGTWQLSQIESDYIVLEADKEVFRVNLNDTNPPLAGHKEPL